MELLIIIEEIVKNKKLLASPSTSSVVVLGTGGFVCMTSICQDVVLTISDLTVICDFLP